MTIRRSALQRAQQDISIASPLALEKRRAMLAADSLLEVEQQFQVPISGIASKIIGFGLTTLTFDVDFFDAPEQRDSSLATPHFTYGVVASFEPADGLLVTACVTEWITDARGAFTGAVVAIGASSGSDSTSQYSGHVHLRFQGYGALTENVETLDVGV